MAFLWIYMGAITSILFFIHCMDWRFLIRNGQLLGYVVHTPKYFTGDLLSMLAYVSLFPLGVRQFLGLSAPLDGVFVVVAMSVMGFVGVRRANAGLRASEERCK